MRIQALLHAVVGALLTSWIVHAGRPVCTSDTCANVKRETNNQVRGAFPIYDLAGLSSRALAPVPDNAQEKSAYVRKTVDALPPGNKIYNDRGRKPESTSLFRAFYTNRGNSVSPAASFNIGLKFLTGCTSVVIVGPSGVYATHFFEDLAMDKSNQKEYAPMLLVNGNKVFDSFVDHFNDLNGSPFKGHNFPEVFIITPVKSKEQPEDKGDKATDTRPASVIGYIEGEEEYDSVYREIYGAIQAKWPEIDSIHKVPYHPLNPSNRGANQMEGSQEKPDHDKLIKTAAGRILFEYDTSRKDRIREVRLWVEENIQLVFTMDPL